MLREVNTKRNTRSHLSQLKMRISHNPPWAHTNLPFLILPCSGHLSNFTHSMWGFYKFSTSRRCSSVSCLLSTMSHASPSCSQHQSVHPTNPLSVLLSSRHCSNQRRKKLIPTFLSVLWIQLQDMIKITRKHIKKLKLVCRENIGCRLKVTGWLIFIIIKKNAIKW